jgi:uncharacterized protein (TIGR03083 family)
MTPADTLAALTAEQERFARDAAVADPAAPVPGCAPWTVDDLVRHLTAVHRWAAAATRTPPGERLPGLGPFEAAATAGDYPAAAAELRAALAGDPDRPCRTLAGPGSVRSWTRRQLHETLVHRHDLAAAAGRSADADPDVAADCIAEVLDTMQPRQLRLGRMPEPSACVRFSTPSASWTLGPGPVVAEVSGPELAVALLLWRRTTADDPRLAVGGDRAAARALLALPLTP